VVGHEAAVSSVTVKLLLLLFQIFQIHST
jgi:hypothetical protein